jgi:hypothetical protein
MKISLLSAPHFNCILLYHVCHCCVSRRSVKAGEQKLCHYLRSDIYANKYVLDDSFETRPNEIGQIS